jgi:UrcA family protein
MLKMLPALAALAAATALVTPTVSQAQEARSERVTFADLDLASGAGQARLQNRIAFAAKNVCDAGRFTDIGMMPLVLACRDDAIAGAQPAFKAAVAAAADHRGTVTVLDGASLVVTRK